MLFRNCARGVYVELRENDKQLLLSDIDKLKLKSIEVNVNTADFEVPYVAAWVYDHKLLIACRFSDERIVHYNNLQALSKIIDLQPNYFYTKHAMQVMHGVPNLKSMFLRSGLECECA